MQLKFLALSLTMILVLSACSKKEEQNQPQTQVKSDVHQVVAQEVIQVSGYTYIRVKEGDKEFWIAATRREIQKGETLYYSAAMEMKNFESEELKRKFESIYFVEDLSNKLTASSASNGTSAMALQPQKPSIEKIDVAVEPAKDGITIAQLFSDINSHAYKTVKIKGKVTKVNSGILKRNWVHIQDGTANGNDFDLTITTNEKVNVGDVITFEGRISLNKDFGAGYSYKVIMEEAKVKLR